MSINCSEARIEGGHGIDERVVCVASRIKPECKGPLYYLDPESSYRLIRYCPRIRRRNR